MKLVCKPLMNGIMAYWSEVEGAVCYNITLYINKQAISQRVNPRTELYCTFNGLASVDGVTESAIGVAHQKITLAVNRTVGIRSYAPSDPSHTGLDYYIEVEAEDRDGNIIEKSEKVRCTVREF